MKKNRLFIIPHTHYDAEVFLTRDVTLKIGADNILDVLYLLDRDPDYRFVLDQRAYLEGFASLYPEQVGRLKDYIASGRLEVAGGLHVMLDVNLPSGESCVRQILYGKMYLERDLGATSTVGWMLDSFGHHPQIPQIMRKAGFDSYVFQRGVSELDKAAFWWVGLDGTKLRCEWLPHTYVLLSNPPDNLPAFIQVMNHVASVLEPYTYNGQSMVLSGHDLSAPDQHLPELIHRFNDSQDDIDLVFATPTEYFAAQPADGLEEVTADLNPIFTGCYAARIALKQYNRELENRLYSAEKLIAVNWAQGIKSEQSLEGAWEPVLFNQFHDLICGSHLDPAYNRAMDRYKRAEKIVGHATECALDIFTARIDTRGEGIPLVALNMLGFPRMDVARCTVGLAQEKWESLALYDQNGEQVPLQVENIRRHPDGSIKRADLVFIAQVPSLGYRTYFLRQGDETNYPTDLWIRPVGYSGVERVILGNHRPNDGRMGNGLVEVCADLRTGALTKLLLREIDWNVVDDGHEHGFGSVCRQEDRGDPWEYYGPLRGAVTSTIPLVDPVPPRGQASFSYEYGGTGLAVGGPVMAEMRVTSPFGDGEFGMCVRIYAGLPRIEFETELVNRQPFVRYRNAFPLNLSDPKITYEIPFGAIERPDGEYPAQNWVDINDGDRGVALLNRGIPGHSLVGNVLTSSLMKCVKVVRYSGGGYSEEEEDTAGFEIGARHRFEQALLPHRGNWQTARLYKEGLAFNVPLMVRKATSHPGDLPAHNSLLTIEPDNLILHAMYVEDDQLVLRVAEAAGRAVEGKIEPNWPISSVLETDLTGKAIEPLKASRTDFDVSATPFEIKTFKIRLSNG